MLIITLLLRFCLDFPALHYAKDYGGLDGAGSATSAFDAFETLIVLIFAFAQFAARERVDSEKHALAVVRWTGRKSMA